jgi:hypothetical protein
MSEFTIDGANRLRHNSLGLVAVTFMVISAAAPLTGVAGAMPLAFILGNGTGIPLTFVLLTLVMLAFAAGYVAMSRHVINAGAFYAYTARGLGGSWGGAVSIMALVAYNAMQFGLIGLLGGVSAGVFSQFGINLPWWAYSLIAIALVGILGYRQVDLSAKVMVVLVGLEYLIVLIVDFAILGAGGAEGKGLAVNILDFSALTSGSLTAAVLFSQIFRARHQPHRVDGHGRRLAQRFGHGQAAKFAALGRVSMGKDRQMFGRLVQTGKLQLQIFGPCRIVVAKSGSAVAADEFFADRCPQAVIAHADHPPWPRIANRRRIVHRLPQPVECLFGQRISAEMADVAAPAQDLLQLAGLVGRELHQRAASIAARTLSHSAGAGRPRRMARADHGKIRDQI